MNDALQMTVLEYWLGLTIFVGSGFAGGFVVAAHLFNTWLARQLGLGVVIFRGAEYRVKKEPTHD